MNTNFYTFLRHFTLALLFIGSATSVFATHSTGADISYQWITGNTYRVQLTFYRDCEGVAAPTAPQVEITGCGSATRTLTLSQDGPAVEISPLCASSTSSSTCNGGTLPGIQRYLYSGVIDLGGTCSAWRFAYTQCCRNGAINDIQAPLNQNIYVEALLNNVVVANNNSSQFTTDPVPYICVGFPFTYNHGAFDADGDSLVYSLITPRTTQTVNVTYLAGFSAQNPLTTSPPNSTVFNTNNGQMTFTPAVAQNGVVAILVQEYRGGVLIGSTVRDMQVITRAGSCTNSSPSFGGPSNISTGVTYNSTTQTFKVCIGSTLSFNVSASDANPGTILTTSATNLATSLPGSTISYSGTNPRIATITWTPTVNDVGFHTIGLTVRDNSCPVVGTGSTTFNVDVPGLTGIGRNRYSVCRGTPSNINLTASVSGTASGTFNWTATPAGAVTFVTPSTNTTRNPTVSVNQAAIITCTYTENGCVSSDTIMIRDYSNLINTPSTLIQCQNGAPVQLGAQYFNNTPTATTPPRCGLFTGAPCTGVVATPQVGTATTTTGTGADGPHPTIGYDVTFAEGSPFQDNNSNASIQYIIRASELTAAGLSRGLLRNIQMNVTQHNSTAAWNGFSVNIGCTSATTFSTTTFLTGLSTVYGPSNLNVPGTGWITLAFATPYEWDGTSNLVVQMCYNNGLGGLFGDGADDVDHVECSQLGYNSTAYMRYNRTSPRGCNATSADQISNIRPNFRFGFCDNITPNITYSWSPSTGLSATNIANPTANVSANTTYTVFATDGFCAQTATVVVSLVNCNNCAANAAISPASTLTCGQTSLQLNAAVSSPILSTNPPTQFAWSGGVQSGGNTATPTVINPGTYTVTMTNTDQFSNTCTSTASITVVANNTPSIANIQTPAQLTCNTTQVTLDATASTPSLSTVGVTYTWAGPATGTIVSGGNTMTPIVNAIGTYTVTITNTNNGCTGTGTVTVTNNTTAPVVSIATPPSITCSATVISLSASGGQGYDWTGPTAAAIVDGSNSPTPTVGVDGTYTVTVTGNNGCTGTSTVQVVSTITPPNANAGPTQVLNCNNACRNIGAASTTPNATYVWDDGSTAIPRSVCLGGIYTLTVTDPLNGCTATSQVVITVDSLVPNFTIAPPSVLTCTVTQIQINGTTTTSSPNITWTSSLGGTTGITSSSTISSPNVDQPATYTVNITNTSNGCSFSTNVVVTRDITQPTANAGLDSILTCARTSVHIGTTATTGYTYSWTTGATTSSLIVANIGTYTVTVTKTANGCTASDDVIITADTAAPDVHAGADQTIDCTTPSGGVVLGGSPTTATVGATIDWSGTIADIANPSSTVSGTYTVIVTNPANGCTASDVVQIQENRIAPTANAGSPQILRCNPTSITLGSAGSVGAGMTYAWTSSSGGNILTNNGNGTIVVNAAGTYTIRVTDPINGCFADDFTTVTMDTVRPNISTGGPYTLTCSTTTLTLNASSTTSNTSFDWQSPLSGQSPSVTTPGIYTVLATNNGNSCTATATATVILNNGAPTADAGLDKTLTCSVASVTIGGNPTSSTPNVTYRWSNNATTPTITVSSAGTYTVTVTNPLTGCTNIDDVLVLLDNAPPIAIADDGNPHILTCTVNAVTIGAVSTTSNVSYSWSGAAGGATPTIQVGVTGTYTVTVTSQTNGCSAISTVVVTEDRSIPNVTVNATSVVLNCTNNQSVTVTAQSSTSNTVFAWSATNQTANITITNPGTYTVTATNTVNGCMNTAITVATLNTIVPNANAGPDKILTCNTPAVVIGVISTTTNVSYEWNNGPISATQLVSLPGTYTVTVTNNVNGCVATDIVLVSEDRVSPVANSGVPQVITCATPSVQIGSPSVANMNYSWSSSLGGNQGFVTAPNQAQPSVNIAATYTVLVTSQINGCSSTSAVVISENKIRPNAVSGTIPDTLKCNVSTIQIGAPSATAGVTYNWSSPPGGTTAIISVTNQGLYYVTVTDGTNGCTATGSWRVASDYVPPVANAGLDKTITCANSTVSIGVISPTPAVSYTWSSGLGSTAVVNTNTPNTYTVTVTRNRNGCTAIDQVVVSANTTAPNANAGVDKTLTCTTTNVSIGVISTTSGVTYQWNNGLGGAPQPSVNLPGTYCVTVTANANGCTAADCVDVIANTTPPVAIANDGSNHQLTCNVTSVSIGAVSPTAQVTYIWNNGNINPIQSVGGTASTYTVTVTSLVNGCTASSNVPVTQNRVLPQACIATPLPITCIRTTAVLNANCSTPSGGITYAWFDGTSANTATAPTTGTYCVTVTRNDNGCTATSCVPVVATVGGVQANISIPANITCNNSSVTLDACNSVPLGLATYLWSTTNDITCTTNVSGTGAYTVTVTNPSNGCTATRSVQVSSDLTPPNANAGSDTELTCVTLCRNVGLPSTTSPVTYIWSNSGGLNATANFCQPGTYTVTVTNTRNGCFATDEVVIIQNTNQPNANAGPDMVLTCSTPTVDLTATSSTPNVTYLWSYGSTPQQTVTVNNFGVYTVTVTDTRNGCTAIDQTQVTIERTPPNANAGVMQIIDCQTPTVTIGATSTTPNVSYSWTSTAGPSAFVGGINNLDLVNVNTAGVYTVIVTRIDNGCASSSQVTVMSNTVPPNANAGSDKFVTCRDTIASIGVQSTTSNVTYFWTASVSGNPFVAPSQPTDPVVSVRSAGTYTVVVTNTLTGCTSSDIVQVEARNLPPAIVIPTPQILTCQVNTVTLSAANSSPSGLTFVWSLGSTPGALITVSAPGTYTVTATNPITGCTNSRTVQVFQSAQVPTVTETITNVTCNGYRNGAINLVIAGTANPQITWADSPTSSPIRNMLGPGSYSVIITSADGCSIGSTFVVTEPARLIATTTATPSNCSNDGSVTANVFGGVQPYAYTWTPTNPATPIITGLSSGEYSVVVTDANGCLATAAAYVNSLVTITPEAAITPVSCANGSDGTITMATSGENPPFTYQWTYGQSTANPLVGIPSGNYDLLITDALGCQTRRSYFVQQPEYLTSTFTTTDAKCHSGCEGVARVNMTGGNGGYVYTWNRNNEHSSYLNAACAGTYTVSVVDIKGCSYTASVTIGQPDTLVVDTIMVNQPTCYQSNDGTLTPSAIGGTTGYTFTWGNLGSGVLQNVQMGIYTVTVTDRNGCTNTRFVNVPEPSPLTGVLSRTNLRCSEDESGTVSVDNVAGGNGGPYTYSINNASQQQTPFFVGLNAGSYNVHIYDVRGCELVLPISINATAPLAIDGGGPFTISMGDSVQVTPAITGAGNPNYVYSWTPAATATNPTGIQTWLKPVETTTYTVTVRDTLQGCIASDKVTVEVLNSKNVYIPNAFSPNGDGHNDYFYVALGVGVKKVKSIQVYDRWGELLFANKDITTDDEKLGWDGMLKGKKMLPGVFTYSVQVEFSNGGTETYNGSVTLLR